MVKCHLIRLNADVDVLINNIFIPNLEKGEVITVIMDEINNHQWKYDSFAVPDTSFIVEVSYPYRGSSEKYPPHLRHSASAKVLEK